MTKELMQSGIEVAQVNQGQHLYEEIPTSLSKSLDDDYSYATSPPDRQLTLLDSTNPLYEDTEMIDNPNYGKSEVREVTMRDCSNILYESTEMMENPTYEKSEVVALRDCSNLLYESTEMMEYPSHEKTTSSTLKD